MSILSAQNQLELKLPGHQKLEGLYHYLKPDQTKPVIGVKNLNSNLKKAEYLYIIDNFVELYPEAKNIQFSDNSDVAHFVLDFSSDSSENTRVDFPSLFEQGKDQLWQQKISLKKRLREKQVPHLFNFSPFLNPLGNQNEVSYYLYLTKISMLLSAVLK